MYKIGSSETTREMLITQPMTTKQGFVQCGPAKSSFLHCCRFDDYIGFGTPSHKPNPDRAFLEWFVGFFEAEGSFLQWRDSNKKDRFGIEVTQKDEKLIHKIRSELGFGLISKIIRGDESYWRYYVHSLKNLGRVISLFNGNLVMVRRQERFKSWLSSFNQRHNTTFLFSQRKPKVSLKNAWLSGFLEGDAGFYVRPTSLTRCNKNGSMKYDIKMKFYITQKGEENVLRQIKDFFQIQTEIYQITNGHSNEKYNRIETHRIECHLLLVNYLTRYCFRGQRFIIFKRWERVLGYRMKDYPITEKSILKLKRLIATINKKKRVHNNLLNNSMSVKELLPVAIWCFATTVLTNL